MDTTTEAARWSDHHEALRVGTLAAGLEPRLYRWWASTSTKQLTDSLAEYAPRAAELGLEECCEQLRAELAYRCAGFVPDTGGASHWCAACGDRADVHHGEAPGAAAVRQIVGRA